MSAPRDFERIATGVQAGCLDVEKDQLAPELATATPLLCVALRRSVSSCIVQPVSGIVQSTLRRADDDRDITTTKPLQRSGAIGYAVGR